MTYVPAQPPELHQQAPQGATVQTVWALWLGNLGAGVGAAVVLFVVLLMLAKVELLPALAWALSGGAVVFGGLMVLRFSLDEIVEAWEWQRLLADNTALVEENDLLRQRIASLEDDINYERLQRAVRARVPEPNRVSVMPTVEPSARKDAETLLQRHYMGMSFARDVMGDKCGWPPSRWNAAMEILKAAGIAQSVGKRTVIQVATMTEAMSRLDAKIVEVEE